MPINNKSAAAAHAAAIPRNLDLDEAESDDNCKKQKLNARKERKEPMQPARNARVALICPGCEKRRPCRRIRMIIIYIH